jgi:elongation factor P|tara:strand:+ start:1927 stop:2535 length:609 start_codon:yes stop_codon:yes gene_type:complete
LEWPRRKLILQKGWQMKINGNEIKPGNIIQHKDSIWVAVKTSHVKPGKGGAFAQVELKKIPEGTKLNERFRASETVERLRLENKTYQYLYTEGKLASFMDKETFEQIELSLDFIGEKITLLQDGMDVEIESHEATPINIAFPDHITLKVVDTEPTVKGQTAAASYKPAELENGLRIMVPPFVQVDESVVINSEDLSYVKRAE